MGVIAASVGVAGVPKFGVTDDEVATVPAPAALFAVTLILYERAVAAELFLTVKATPLDCEPRLTHASLLSCVSTV